VETKDDEGKPGEGVEKRPNVTFFRIRSIRSGRVRDNNLIIILSYYIIIRIIAMKSNAKRACGIAVVVNNIIHLTRAHILCNILHYNNIIAMSNTCYTPEDARWLRYGKQIGRLPYSTHTCRVSAENGIEPSGATVFRGRRFIVRIYNIIIYVIHFFSRESVRHIYTHCKYIQYIII